MNGDQKRPQQVALASVTGAVAGIALAGGGGKIGGGKQSAVFGLPFLILHYRMHRKPGR